MFKNILIKKMLKAQGVSEEQAEMAITMMEKNPTLFSQIVSEIDAEIKSGKDRTKAAIEIMQKYQSEIKELSK